jgi:oxygen-independent coproporphyrinogen-3 oxidase
MKLKNGFLEALLKEIVLQNNFLMDEPVETIYFGGGTPSLLSATEIDRIIKGINQNFPLVSNPEITLEVNPDDVTTPSLVAWKQANINRLSIGVQSFFDKDLRWMNRAHNSLQAEKSIMLAQEVGFHNLTIDLIFGSPTLSDENWMYNVKKAISLNIPHLSCYALTVEPKTQLANLIHKKTLQGVNGDDQARQFLSLMACLEVAGYEHYEISNFALPGKRSKHNSSYWQGRKYLGLGPSAHSFNGDSRQWNVSNNALYIQSLKHDTIPAENEQLTPVQKVNEWVMIALRTKEGLDFDSQPHYLSEEIRERIKHKSLLYQNQGLMILESNTLKLTSSGKLFADGIAAALFFDETELTDAAFAGGS